MYDDIFYLNDLLIATKKVEDLLNTLIEREVENSAKKSTIIDRDCNTNTTRE